MQRRIGAMRGHMIVCGWGRAGQAIARRAGGADLVVADASAGRIGTVTGPCVHGDTTSEEVLRAAATRPRGLASTPLQATSVPSPSGLHLVSTRSGHDPMCLVRGNQGEEFAMDARLRRRDAAVPGTPAAPAAQTTRGGSIMRTLRSAWRPRFLIAGVVLAVIGVMLLSGTAQALVALGGVVVFVFAATRGLLRKSWDKDRRREPPMPPGGGAPIQGFLFSCWPAPGTTTTIGHTSPGSSGPRS